MGGGVRSAKWKLRRKLTTESQLAKSPSGVFRFWEGEAGRAVREKRKNGFVNIPRHDNEGRTRGTRTRTGDIL